MSRLQQSKIERAVDTYAALMMVIVMGLVSGGAFVGAVLAYRSDAPWPFTLASTVLGFFGLAPFSLWIGGLVDAFKEWRKA